MNIVAFLMLFNRRKNNFWGSEIWDKGNCDAMKIK